MLVLSTWEPEKEATRKWVRAYIVYQTEKNEKQEHFRSSLFSTCLRVSRWPKSVLVPEGVVYSSTLLASPNTRSVDVLADIAG